MSTYTFTIKINVFRDGGVWFGARWFDDRYDGCDALDIPDASTTEDAIDAARMMPMTVIGERVIAKVDDVEGG